MFALIGLAALFMSQPAAVAARQPGPSTSGPAITSGPRAWALATSAFLTYYNRSRIDVLCPDTPSDSNVAQMRDVLRRRWRVRSRADLVRALDWVNHEGHRQDFQRLGQSLLSMTGAQYRSALAAERSRPDRVRIMKVAREHFRKHRRSCLIAWDYGRYIMLCRWGFMLGFLTEDEAWGRIMPAAGKIQHAFHSWAEFGEDYLIGREFWSSEEMRETGKIYRDIERWLLREPQSPWKRLPWRMQLGLDVSPHRVSRKPS